MRDETYLQTQMKPMEELQYQTGVNQIKMKTTKTKYEDEYEYDTTKYEDEIFVGYFEDSEALQEDEPTQNDIRLTKPIGIYCNMGKN